MKWIQQKLLVLSPQKCVGLVSLVFFMQIWLTWLFSADRSSCANCSALLKVRTEECCKCHDSMMRWAPTHLLMIFQNMLLHFPPVVHSAHLLNATFLAGSRKFSFSAQRVMFCFFLSCFSLTVLTCIQTWHWSNSGAWTWCAEWYCSSESLLISKRKPY